MALPASTSPFILQSSGLTTSVVLFRLSRPICWVLGALPFAPVFMGYMAGAVLLARTTLRRVRPVTFDLDHPALNPRVWTGVHPQTGFGLLQLMVLLCCGGTGFVLPRMIADAMIACQYHPWGFGTPTPIGLFGRLAELVGGVCGVIIGMHAFGFILRWTMIACGGFLALQMLHWLAG